ncbi:MULTISPECIES: hypothetical protein [Pectobacterium]|uniref:hypothetical protein n=1 Tax=Pectobacterium TaxID=122277 RepID=UPI00383A3042
MAKEMKSLSMAHSLLTAPLPVPSLQNVAMPFQTGECQFKSAPNTVSLSRQKAIKSPVFFSALNPA